MQKRQLVFDIETIGEDYETLDHTTQEVLTRWIKKESRNESEYEVALADVKDGLGFSPLTGQIVAIGILDVSRDMGAVYYQDPNSEGKEFTEKNIKFKAMSEKEMLDSFWQGGREYDQFISYNGRGFDAPFMNVRSAVHGIRPSKNLMPNRYDPSTHLDLQDVLNYYGSVRRKGSLHLWCRAFGIESPKTEGVKGDDVSGLFKEGKYIDIARYNVRDLYATRDLFKVWEKYFKF